MDTNSKLSFKMFFHPLSTKSTKGTKTIFSNTILQPGSKEHKPQRNIIYFN